MYDPMVAKLIVWDADREQATARMLRALAEYEIGSLKTLIPFHDAILRTEQWARAKTCRDLIEDRGWLKSLAFPKADKPAQGEDEPEKVEQSYTVEVSGKRFDVRVIGPPPPGRRQWRRPTGSPRPQAGPTDRPSGCFGDVRATPDLPASGDDPEGRSGEGRRCPGGSPGGGHRGHEDGERDHGPQVRHGHRTPDRCGCFGGLGDTLAVIIGGDGEAE